MRAWCPADTTVPDDAREAVFCGDSGRTDARKPGFSASVLPKKGFLGSANTLPVRQCTESFAGRVGVSDTGHQPDLVKTGFALPPRSKLAGLSRYAVRMRISISLDDRLVEEVRREAAARGLSVSALVSRMVGDILNPGKPARERPFRLVTVGGTGPCAGIGLDRPREFETEEDEARFA